MLNNLKYTNAFLWLREIIENEGIDSDYRSSDLSHSSLRSKLYVGSAQNTPKDFTLLKDKYIKAFAHTPIRDSFLPVALSELTVRPRWCIPPSVHMYNGFLYNIHNDVECAYIGTRLAYRIPLRYGHLLIIPNSIYDSFYKKRNRFTLDFRESEPIALPQLYFDAISDVSSLDLGKVGVTTVARFIIDTRVLEPRVESTLAFRIQEDYTMVVVGEPDTNIVFAFNATSDSWVV